MDLFSKVDEPVLPFIISDEIDSSYYWDKKLNLFFIKIPNGELIFSECFFNKKISDRCLEYFQENSDFDWKVADWSKISEDDFRKINFNNIKWEQDEIKLYGKVMPLPRLTSWYGDQGKFYIYSGIKLQPNKWNKGLSYIKKELERISCTQFNSVLLNWYRDGNDYLNWHSDDESELGDSPIIASINFGETRDFLIRRSDNPAKKITIPLKHGTLLIMRGEIQQYWQHSIPKRKRVKKSRFNLTFRYVY